MALSPNRRLLVLSSAGVVGALVSTAVATQVRLGYDTAYAIAWGRDLAAGGSLDFGHPSSPTPHPLSIALAWLVGYLPGAWASGIAGVIAAASGVLALVALTALAHELTGRALPTALTAACVLVAAPVGLLVLQAGFDVPYTALGVVGVWLTVRRWYVGGVVLLSLAALLRPEAAVLAGGVWLVSGRSASVVRVWIAGTAAAVAAWLVTGWAGGDALVSLHSAAGNADLNDDPRGLGIALIQVVPDLAAATGVLVLIAATWTAVVALRSRRESDSSVRVVTWFVVAGVGLYIAQGLLGTPLVARYLLLPALLCVPLAAAATVEIGARARAPRARTALGIGLAAVLLVSTVVSNAVPWRDVAVAREIQAARFTSADELLDTPLARTCDAPFVVRSPAMVPVVALSLDRRLDQIIVDDAAGPGVVLQPLTLESAALSGYGPMYSLERQARFPVDAPPRASNTSWALYSRCQP